MNVIGYGCYTAAGKGAHALYQGLLAGRDYCSPLDDSTWPAKPMTGARLCFWPESPPGASQCEKIVQALLACVEEAIVNNPAVAAILNGNDLGVIFASTKGCIEDVVWRPDFLEDPDDTLQPVLDGFLKASGIAAQQKISISNACSSVHGAVFLANSWMASGRVKHVLIIAADSIGPFVVNGFSALKTFAETRVTPFARDRQGIQIGDAAAAIVLSRSVSGVASIAAVAIESDGFAATRSDQEGVALETVVTQVLAGKNPDLIIAHATGTPANDVVEDAVYGKLFGQNVPVTATKWSVGHGLGASGGIDLIAALEVLKHQMVFSIANTALADPCFKGRYLVASAPAMSDPVNRIMTTTMGFGGMHGAMVIESSETRETCSISPAAAVGINVFKFSVETPALAEPAWAKDVPRWHQLDDVTFAVVEALHQFRERCSGTWQECQPALVWLAARGGSNLADFEFVSRGSRSPSRFVGTLPSIKSSSLALIMNWQGPVLCLQSGDQTAEHGLQEMFWHQQGRDGQPAWLVTHTRIKTAKGFVFKIVFFLSGAPDQSEFLLTSDTRTTLPQTDVLSWLDQQPSVAVPVGSGVAFSRNKR